MVRLTGGVVATLALVALLGCLLMSQSTPLGTAQPPRAERQRDEFAADRASVFDSGRAMKYLEAICKLGPRISGSDGMKKQQELLRKHFEGLGGEVSLQAFTARQRSRREPTEMANLIVSWFPDRKQRVIVCSHYDTRPIADQEPDRRRWAREFISANDGGSGVALLMELGHHMKELKTNVGVDFVFFDGEEYIFDPGTDFREGDVYFFGSEYFARNIRRDRPQVRYGGAVLLDMIGGKDAKFPIEQYSWGRAGPLVEMLWGIAREQRSTAFVKQMGPAVRDDHLALNEAGIPAVDIIDFSYTHWHRLSDTPEQCSPASLDQVARVLLAWLKRL
jgi:hypothetical protein